MNLYVYVKFCRILDFIEAFKANIVLIKSDFLFIISLGNFVRLMNVSMIEQSFRLIFSFE